MQHLTEAQINDFVDDALGATARADAARHLETCSECRAEVEILRSMLERVGRLPRVVHPGQDLRTGIWAQADRRTLWHWRYPLAAAAVLLIAATAVLTVMLTRETDGVRIVRATPAASTIDLVRLEERYRNEVTELERTLAQNRAQLAPETVRILETNLQIIDAAIGEARAALANDPQSAMLGELLRSAYQRKLDVLKQAARSSAET